MHDKRMKRFGRYAGVVSLATAVALSWTLAGPASAAPFKLAITTATLTGHDLLLAGTAESPAGNQSGNYVVVDWGDGSSEVLPNFDTPSPWTWGPLLHTYAVEGAYTVTATLKHASPNGNDQSQATDTQDIVVEDPIVEDPIVEDPIVEDPIVEDPIVEDPIVEDPIDLGDDPVDEGTVVDDGTDIVESDVLSGAVSRNRPKAKTVQAKTPKVLASTGTEATAAWLGVIFLLIGIGLRSLRLRPLRPALALSGVDPARSFGANIIPAVRRSPMFGLRRAARHIGKHRQR